MTAFDWNNIHESVLPGLGERRSQGWVEALTLSLESVKQEVLARPDITGGKLPDITQIKQKWGGLRVYTSGGQDWIVRDIISHAQRIEQTCEYCPNTADVQQIQGFFTTLCAWCYNRELARRGIDVNDPVHLDVAEEFPDLVRPECASLRPATGHGWFDIIAYHLRQLEHAIEDEGLDLGAVVISDVTTGKDGRLQFEFHKTHPCVDHVVSTMERSSASTCAKCGHRGDVVRAKDKSDLLCSHCYVRTVAWNPFEEGDE